MRKNCARDREKLLKFKAEGREFAKFLRSLEQFIQTMKGKNGFSPILALASPPRLSVMSYVTQSLRQKHEYILTAKGQYISE